MNVVVVGLGYVGLANAILLSKNHSVVGIELSDDKIYKLKQGISPISDRLIEKVLPAVIESGNFSVSKQIDAVAQSDIYIIATPTNYDVETNEFDTSSVDSTIEKISSLNKNAIIFIKSTIPVGYTESVRKKFKSNKIYFSPEFLREGNALYDNLNPSRIIVGGMDESASNFANMLKDCSDKENVEILLTNSTEAEAIKLFSNTYLAMRVAFFNELDTFSELKALDSSSIIRGVSLDPRIGNYYNNPSFGYGGYCLPKDTKQLLANYDGVPQVMMGAIVEANKVRKKHIFESVTSSKPKTVGIYRLIMKTGSDNFRESAIFDVIKMLLNDGYQVILYEPYLKDNKGVEGVKLISDFGIFANEADVIISNRIDDILQPFEDKIYSRDIFKRDWNWRLYV